MRGDPPPRREAGQGVTGCLTQGAGVRGANPDDAGCLVSGTLNSRPNGSGGLGTDFDLDGGLTAEVAPTLNAHFGAKQGLEDQHALNGAGLFVGHPTAPPLTGNPYGDHESREGLLVADTLRSHPRPGSNSVGGIVAVQERATREQGQNGIGVNESGAAYTLEGIGTAQEIAFQSKASAHQSLNPSECAPTLDVGKADGMAVGIDCSRLTDYGISHADAKKAGPVEALCALRKALGEEAFQRWCLGVIARVQAPEILRPTVHGSRLRRAADNGDGPLDGPLPRAEDRAVWTLRTVWGAGCEGCPPQGSELPEQHAEQLGADLSGMPHSGAQAEAVMSGMWRASQGLRAVRKALSALQEVGRPAEDQAESAHPRYVVRRLSPLEAERLMGLPDNFTAVPHRGKPMADGPRYRLLGNSMAVNCMRWIGERIALVEKVIARP